MQLGILQANSALPFGSASDAPGWGTRGMMLDIGRHFYPADFLTDLCAYMSMFKQNTLHAHLSDNLWSSTRFTPAQYMETYARLRLWSDDAAVAGLNQYANESYTRAEFEVIQTACAARGVTVLPEIEAPGHALVITQWKPQLAWGRDMTQLNISHPETVPAMQALWGTFLDWFHCKVVSIGADEYSGPSDDYYAFVNAMAGFIGARSGKLVRTWGMYPPTPQNPRPLAGNVSVQHWEFFEDDPYADYIANNYSVVNSNDDFYIVNKFGGYPSTIDVHKTFVGSPDGGFWRPNIFHIDDAARNPPARSRLVLGAIAPLWNDQGPNATVYSEAYYAWRTGLPALADKQWGGSLAEARFQPVFDQLHPHIPAQNLERTIPSAGSVIFNYTFSGMSSTVPDASPNRYHAQTDCPRTADGALSVSPSCSVTTPLASKGRDYTLALSLRITRLDDHTNATLLVGRDSALMLTPVLTLFAGGNYFRLSPAMQPAAHLGAWVDVQLVGRGNQTFATMAPAASPPPVREEFRAILGMHGSGLHSAEIAVEAPLQTLGGAGSGWAGEVRRLSLTSVAV